ncbi:MAG: zinc-binding dehydrogenase [Candidatus Aminicenantales bacterium]
MKAALLTGIRKMEGMDVPPPPRPGSDKEVLLRVLAVGICGTDILYYNNGRIGEDVISYPFIIGHECVAEVVDIVAGWLKDLMSGDESSSAAVLGSGPIGLATAMAARESGVRRIYMTDRVPERVEAAKIVADWSANPETSDVVAGILEMEPLGVDAVFECSGDQEAFDQAAGILKPGGKLLVIGIPEAEQGKKRGVFFGIIEKLCSNLEKRLSSKKKLSHRKKKAEKSPREASSEKKRTARIKESFTPYLKIEINKEFKIALDLLQNTSKNVFITGKAGTGKSTLLEYFRENTKKKVVVLAPTGVAALNVRGQTIHSFFKFKPDITLDKVKRIVKNRRKNLYQAADTIVIDEISMVRADLLDCVDRFLRLNCAHEERPFGGKQMVFIGDLYQLPPVIKGKEREIFKTRYKTGYFFSAHSFEELPMDFIELVKIYRQKDERFIEILNAIRNSTITEEMLEVLNSRHDPDFEPAGDEFHIYLTTLNQLADKINSEQLRRIKGLALHIEGIIRGNFDIKNLPTQMVMPLKVGAQVMLLNNDPYGRWVNGSVGRVKEILGPLRSSPEIILVELAEGSIVEVEPFTWEIFEYRYDEESNSIQTKTIGSFTQFPLRLAWAITIHKSQGKTFQRIILDIQRGIFSPGQIYVALSRCTTLEGIVLRQPIQKKHVFMDWRVVDFLTKYQYRKSEERMPLEEKIDFLQQVIKKKSRLEIVYLKKSDEKSRRIIEPLYVGELFYEGRPFLGLEAYCHRRKERRNFRVDRILEMKILEE